MNQRRNIFIDRSFQSKFIITFCGIILVSTIVIAGILLYLSQDATTVTLGDMKVTVKGTADFMFPLLFQTLLIVTVFTAAVIVGVTMLTSHKISGPLFNISRVIKDIKDGDLTRHVHLRRNDQVRILADNLNELIDTLRDRHLALKKAADRLRTALLDAGINDDEVEKELKVIEENADYFRT